MSPFRQCFDYNFLSIKAQKWFIFTKLDKAAPGDTNPIFTPCRHYGACSNKDNPTYAATALSNYRSHKQQKIAQNKCNGNGLCTGKYIWPTRGTVTSEFSLNRCTLGDCREHFGIDIANVTGTPVNAADGGKVIAVVYSNSGWGNRVEIRHCNGTVTLYAHLDRARVSVG
jgi:murein DD-endopeptidase MepM/ murein hydrolase activator NlpD